MDKPIIEKHCLISLMIAHLSLVSIRAEESIMLLSFLSSNHSLQIDINLFVDKIDSESIKDLVHFVHDVWVLHHFGGVEPDEVMFSHIICQICKYKSTLLGLIDRRAVELDVVALSIHINLLLGVIDDVSGRHNPAISYTEMEQREQIIYVLGGQEIGNFESQIEPSWN